MSLRATSRDPLTRMRDNFHAKTSTALPPFREKGRGPSGPICPQTQKPCRAGSRPVLFDSGQPFERLEPLPPPVDRLGLGQRSPGFRPAAGRCRHEDQQNPVWVNPKDDFILLVPTPENQQLLRLTQQNIAGGQEIGQLLRIGGRRKLQPRGGHPPAFRCRSPPAQWRSTL